MHFSMTQMVFSCCWCQDSCMTTLHLLSCMQQWSCALAKHMTRLDEEEHLII